MPSHSLDPNRSDSVSKKAAAKTGAGDLADSGPEADSCEHIFSLDHDHQLVLIIADARWQAQIDEALEADCGQLVKFVSGLLEQSGFTACLRLTDDQEMQELNHQFRETDKATNVLSFADGSADEAYQVRLGDLAFGYETMAAEAEHLAISVGAHLRHLIIHGLLHLIGFDHMDEEEAEEMEGLEIAALALIGVDNPYQTALLGEGV